MNYPKSMDDIIFKNRNKVYGAYVLRSEFSFTLLKSLFTTMGIALAIACICFKLSQQGPLPQAKPLLLPPQQTILHTTPIDLSPQQREQQKQTATPNANNNSNQATVVVRDSVNFTTDTVPTTTQAIVATNEHKVIDGEGKPEGKEGGLKSTTGVGTTNDTVVALIADEYPEFEGGLAALNRWIASQLRYPPEAIEYTKQGKVHVKFIVDEEGRVQYPMALNKPGYGLEQEALRVVSGIPKFKSPAKINGQAVKCYFVLPINFKLY